MNKRNQDRLKIEDIKNKLAVPIISSKFHNSISNMIVAVSKIIRKEQDINMVALSGGVWQNLYLLRRTHQLLADSGFSVLIHNHTPANDGGISIGQAMITNANIIN